MNCDDVLYKKLELIPSLVSHLNTYYISSTRSMEYQLYELRGRASKFGASKKETFLYP